MRRIFLAAIPLLLLIGIGAYSAGSTLAAHGKCGKHGYSHGHCHAISPGGTGSTTPPNAPVTISFTNPYTFPVNIASAAVATPAGAPAGAACFSAEVFNASTGQELTGTLQAPLVFSSNGTILVYDSSTGTFTPLSGNESLSGGIFCYVTSAPGIGLPGTGGAAGA